jgi:hypothetical protein
MPTRRWLAPAIGLSTAALAAPDGPRPRSPRPRRVTRRRPPRYCCFTWLGGYPVGVVLREPDARRDAAYSAGERGLQRVRGVVRVQYPTAEDASR